NDEFYAHVSQGRQVALLDVRGEQHARFGDLQRKPRRVNAGGFERGAHDPSEVRAAYLLTRDVYKDLPGEFRVIGDELARLVKNKGAKLDHQVRFFHRIQEVAREEQTAVGVIPAHERFVRHRAFSSQIHDGLVVDCELTAANRGTKLGFN